MPEASSIDYNVGSEVKTNQKVKSFEKGRAGRRHRRFRKRDSGVSRGPPSFELDPKPFEGKKPEGRPLFDDPFKPHEYTGDVNAAKELEDASDNIPPANGIDLKTLTKEE